MLSESREQETAIHHLRSLHMHQNPVSWTHCPADDRTVGPGVQHAPHTTGAHSTHLSIRKLKPNDEDELCEEESWYPAEYEPEPVLEDGKHCKNNPVSDPRLHVGM